ncbi:MAG: hypothetical protein DRR15_12465 [Gammaproteobacteria bacterium]|nr:MAG: hypothetical protein DRR15_12465 [Gammaproteobacteria bacterium]
MNPETIATRAAGSLVARDKAVGRVKARVEDNLAVVVAVAAAIKGAAGSNEPAIRISHEEE